MKALIGLDLESESSPILKLFARIGFSDCRVTVAHAVPSMTSSEEMPHWMRGIYEEPLLQRTSPAALAIETERKSTALLEQSRKVLYEDGIHSCSVILHGNPANALMEAADEMHADVVCACSTISGPMRSAIFGSVCRALVIGAKQSVLIAKKLPPEDRPLTAILAYDHSLACERGVEKLLAMDPMGIQKLVVLTAVTPKEYDALWAMYELPESEQQTLRVDVEQLHSRNEEVAEKFRSRNMEAISAVLQRDPRHAINETMETHKADLLIMAAQGHGFIERVTIGSLSLHEAVAENHSLLILR